MKIKLRWKLKPAATGLMAVGAGPRGSILHDGEKTFAQVIAHRGGTSWYWVAGWDSDVPYMNTCEAPVPTAEEAKAQALAYVKCHIQQAPEQGSLR